MSEAKPTYAFLVGIDSSYGTVKIQAHIVRVEENGDFRNPGCQWPYEDQSYADFYVNQFADNGKPTGAHAEYVMPYSVDLPRAERMVKTLRTVTRGLAKMRDAEGYIGDCDLPALLFRVARILKIKSFYVRNTAEARERSGEMWRKADAASVQMWYSQALENIANGKVSTYGR